MGFNEQNYQPSKALASLSDFLTPENARSFTDDLYAKNFNPKQPDTLLKASLEVEFVDNVLGYDSATLATHAFYRGGLIGNHIIDLSTTQYKIKPLVSKALENMLVWCYDTTDKIEDNDSRRMARAQQILDLGNLGCKMFPEFTAAVENIEDYVVGDVTKSLFMRPGLGFSLYALNSALKKHEEIEFNTDMVRMKTEITLLDRGENTIDWDAFPGLSSDS